MGCCCFRAEFKESVVERNGTKCLSSLAANNLGLKNYLATATEVKVTIHLTVAVTSYKSPTSSKLSAIAIEANLLKQFRVNEPREKVPKHLRKCFGQ